MHSELSYKVRQLRTKNQNVMMTAVTVLLASLFATALLPSLLVQYVYAGQQLLAAPPLLEYIPVASFAIGFGYFLIAVIGNIFRARRANYLDKKIELEGWDNCCHHHMDEMTETTTLAEAIVSEKKKPAKKSKKKSSKSKKSSSSKK